MRTAFTQENVVAEDGYPRLKLAKDEVSRIVCLENPWSKYVHNLQAPKLLNGKPVMETKKRMDKSEYEAYEMDFFGNPICLGDPGILVEKGKDPKNCPACAEAENSDRVWAPKRRHAMHVVKYETKARGVLSEPFMCRVVMWCFTENIFEQLVTIASNNKGGLPKHDLILGPPEEPVMFQKFKIVTCDEAEWLKGGEDRKKLVVEIFQKNKAGEDLSDPFCGKTKNREWMLDALAKVRARWNIVNGVGNGISSDMSVVLDNASLSEGLDSLLNTESSTSTSLDSTMTDLLETKSEPKSEGAPKPGSSGESIDGFEDLISSLGN